MNSELPPLPPTIDAIAAYRLEHQSISQSPWLNEEIGKRMTERLQWIKQSVHTGLDWNVLNGGTQAHLLLQHQSPNTQWFACESTAQRQAQAALSIKPTSLGVGAWLKEKIGRISSNSANPPLKPTIWQTPAPRSVDMVWANMSLHTSKDPLSLLQKWRELIAVNGMLMFSCLGPDSLMELRNLYQEQAWPAPCQDFTDMHDWGDMLIAAGYTEPVMDVERITLSYTSAKVLLRDLAQWGHNLHPQRFAGLRGKKWLAQLELAIEEKIAAQMHQGGMRLTFEVIYGHAIQASPRIAVKDTSQISLEDMKRMLQQKPNS